MKSVRRFVLWLKLRCVHKLEISKLNIISFDYNHSLSMQRFRFHECLWELSDNMIFNTSKLYLQTISCPFLSYFLILCSLTTWMCVALKNILGFYFDESVLSQISLEGVTTCKKNHSNCSYFRKVNPRETLNCNKKCFYSHL